MDGFQKKRVYEQVAKQLESRIQSAEWSGQIPSERRLSDDFGVSRDQVHAAILLLRERGIIELVGKRNVIKELAKGRRMQREKVVVVTPDSLQLASHGLLCCLDHLRKRLSKDGITVQLETTPALLKRSPGKSLQRLVDNYPNAVWVLHKAPESVQKWFSNKMLAALVLGTATELSKLDYVDIDHAAATRHAVGVLRRAGHKMENVLFLRPATNLEGVARMEEAYRAEVTSLGKEPCVFSYRDNTSLGLRMDQLLDRAIELEAILVTSYKAACFLPGWLAAERGLIVGKDLSLICLSDGPSLEFQHPSVAYYAMLKSGLSTKLVNMVKQKLKEGERFRGKAVMPEFVAGGSLCAGGSS